MSKNHILFEHSDFPERTQDHVQETQSRGIFLGAIPERWIPRDISERDYGVDALVEIIPETLAGKGWRVSGDIAALQFKSKRSPMVWADVEGTDGLQRSILSGVNTSTVKYWLSLPMPVFICLADLTSKKMYFANVNEQVRTQFSNLKQGSMSFAFYNTLEITSPQGPRLFEKTYYRESYYGDFGRYSSDLVLGYGRYKQFLQDHGWQDIFLPVEDPDVVLLLHLWTLLRKTASLCGLPWHLTELAEWFEKDATDWPEDNEQWMLHEATMANIVKELEPAFDDITNKVVERITDVEADYWKEMEYPLYRLCNEWDWWKNNEKRLL